MDIIQESELALEYLRSRGKLNLPFNATRKQGIEAANLLAFELECQRLSDSLASGHMDFEGNENCDDTCQGWAPGNRRCSCGNRRVDFVMGDGHSFLNPFVYAEAW